MQFITKIIAAENSKGSLRRLIFLPAGIPGMGKTTIGRFLE